MSGGADSTMSDGRPPKGREEAAYRHHYAALLHRPDITGIGIGLRKRNGRLINEKVVKVFVAHKRSESDLPAGAMLPRVLTAPDGAAAVDVEEMLPPDIPPLHAPRVDTTMAEARLRVPRRPAVGGASVAHHAFPVGTVALGVRHRQTGAHCILSCNHVLSQLGAAQLGDEVLQPARFDGGVWPSSIIGRVLRWTPVAFFGLARNMTDAAIADCGPGQVRSWVDGIGAITGIAPPIEPGARVRKVGRATGLTSGIVTTVGAAVWPNYAPLGFGETPALFVNQIVAEIECAYGDSGSLLVDDENRAVGLLFGGTRSGHTWFNPFDAVCAALDIALLDEDARAESRGR
jgi:hypothetical protein